MAVPYLACMALVAQIYALPPRVLPSIQAVEGGGPGVAQRNQDGSEDLGVMQINTLWLPTLSRYSKLPISIVREQLLQRSCYNIAAAGLILRTYLDEAGGNLMQAVGNYHSHTPVHHQSYRVKVTQAAFVLFPPAPASAMAPSFMPVSAGANRYPPSRGSTNSALRPRRTVKE